MGSLSRSIAKSRIRARERAFQASTKGLERVRPALLLSNLLATHAAPRMPKIVIRPATGLADPSTGWRAITVDSTSESTAWWAEAILNKASQLLTEIHMDNARFPESVDAAVTEISAELPRGVYALRAAGFPPLVQLLREGTAEVLANVRANGQAKELWVAEIRKAIAALPELPASATQGAEITLDEPLPAEDVAAVVTSVDPNAEVMEAENVVPHAPVEEAPPHTDADAPPPAV